MRDAAQVQHHLDSLVVELDALSGEQDQAIDDVGSAQDRWETTFDTFVEQFDEERSRGDHPGAYPGRERLEDMCRRASGDNRQAWRDLRAAERELDKKVRRASNVRAQISGIQSELRTMADEARAPAPSQSPSGPVFGRAA